MFKAQQKTKEPENFDKAYDYAVFLLSLQLRTTGEVEKKMEGRGYGHEIIADVVRQLKGQKYLDDQSYAEVYLENLKKYKNFGYYGIKKKFMEKRLPTEIIEKILANRLPVEEEIKIAKRLLKKEGFAVKTKSANEETQYRTFDEESAKQKQKLAQKLKARGFRGEVIAKLVF
jgi:regulatory protein